MLDEKAKHISSNNKKINSNEILTSIDQKNIPKEEKNLEINSYTRTLDSSQKGKNKEIELEEDKYNYINDINLNSLKKDNSKISLNKDQLYKTFLLFQKFLSATQSLNNDKNKENNIINDSNFISAINNFNKIITIKENNNIINYSPKDISKFNIDTDNNEIPTLTQNCSTNCQQYNKNTIIKIKNQVEENKNIKNNNNIISDKKESNKFGSKNNSFSKNKNISQEIIKKSKDINYSKININKNNNNINESFTQNKKYTSNDYSFDFSNNNIDYSVTIGDSLQIMPNDLINGKKYKNKIKLNINSIKYKNHNKTSKSNEINKIIYNINNDTIQSARDRIKNNYINGYNNKGEELIKNIKKIKIIKNKDEKYNYNNIKDNKEQIIEERIKELNNETIKFREETDKIIKIKNEYEKLHEKLIKDIDNFNIKKDEFEKYKLEELNKINEEKKNIDSYSNIITNLKLENQSLNISNKKDKEMINHLKDYINQLKLLIKKKDEEIKLLSKNNNINNYIINSYRTIGNSKEEKMIKNNKENKNKTFRNSILSNNFIEKLEGRHTTNLSCSKIKKNNEYKNRNISGARNSHKINESNSLININDYSKIEKKQGRNYKNTEDNCKDFKLSSFSYNSQTKLNISKNQKIKLNIIPKKIYKEKKIKNNEHKKLTTDNINIKSVASSNKDNNNNNSKNLNYNPYTNIKNIKKVKEFSKTSSNFLKPIQIQINNNKEYNNNISNDKLLEQNINFNIKDIIDKMKLNKDYQYELKKPLDKNEYDFVIPEKYIKNNYKLCKREKIDNKEIYIYTNNKKEIKFQSGLKKVIYDDGFELIYFQNGDIKQNHPNGKSVYFFKDSNTVQTSYLNGIQIFKFYNGQIEKHFPNGFKKIIFPNGKIDYIFEEKKENE